MNYLGSAISMEAKATRILFKRILANRYAEFISDGNSSAYKSVRNIYVPDWLSSMSVVTTSVNDLERDCG